MKIICEACGIKSVAVQLLNSQEVALMDKNCAQTLYKKGEIIFKQNTLTGHVVFIRTGLAKIHKIGSAGKDQIIKIVKSPSYLGLETLFGDTINQYSATAIENVEICAIHLSVFKNLILTNGKFSLEIIKDISRNQLEYFNRIVNHQQKNLTGRTAEVLLFFQTEVYHSSQFTIPLTHSELAALLGASRESITRVIAELKREGIIDTIDKTTLILDTHRLRQLCLHG